MRLCKLGVINYRAFGPLDDDTEPTTEEIPMHWINYSNDIISLQARTTQERRHFCVPIVIFEIVAAS